MRSGVLQPPEETKTGRTMTVDERTALLVELLGCATSHCTTTGETVRLCPPHCQMFAITPAHGPWRPACLSPLRPSGRWTTRPRTRFVSTIFRHLPGLLRPRKDSNLRLRFRNAVEWVSASHLESHLTCSASVFSSSGLVEHHAVARGGWTSGWTILGRPPGPRRASLSFSEWPNLATTFSRTFTPSRVTSVPIPSPGTVSTLSCIYSFGVKP